MSKREPIALCGFSIKKIKDRSKIEASEGMMVYSYYKANNQKQELISSSASSIMLNVTTDSKSYDAVD